MCLPTILQSCWCLRDCGWRPGNEDLRDIKVVVVFNSGVSNALEHHFRGGCLDLGSCYSSPKSKLSDPIDPLCGEAENLSYSYHYLGLDSYKCY